MINIWMTYVTNNSSLIIEIRQQSNVIIVIFLTSSRQFESNSQIYMLRACRVDI